MTFARGTTLLAAMLAGAVPVLAQQDGMADAEARSRALSERMRVSLEQQSKALSKMQRDLERASRANVRVRDSIVRATSQSISELAMEIARVQMEADRVQQFAVDAVTRAQLRVQIESARAMANVTRALAGQQRALTFSTRAVPRGYLGVILSGEQNTELRDGKVFTIYASPTLIESVEPGSPAAAAGLEAGDTIVAFGKLSVPGAVPLAEIMVPGEKLPVKIRRSGRERALTVTVGTRSSASSGGTVMAYGPMEFRVCTGGDACGSGAVAAVAPHAPVSPSPRGAPAEPLPPLIPGPGPEPLAELRALGRGSPWSEAGYTIAGAVMTTISEDLEELTGVDQGILVLRVAPGTPAATSGLRGGDVIIRVSDEECEGVRDLQLAVQRASSRGARRVALIVSRKQQERSISLQW